MIPQDSGVLHSPTRRIIDVQKTNICQICGDKGDLKRLIYCVQCKACAEHSYCLEKLHREDGGTVSWKCEECAPKNPKCGSEQSRKSERISHAAEAKYNRMNLQKECVGAEFPGKNGIEKRLLILEDMNLLYEEHESPKVPLNISSNKQALEHKKCVESGALTSHPLYYPKFDMHSSAHPLSDPVWTGQFRLNNATDFGLISYASSKACSKVHSAVKMLPKLLDVETLLRNAIWPKSFDMFPPNSESIGLFFSPV